MLRMKMTLGWKYLQWMKMILVSMMKNLEMKNPGMKSKELKNYPAATYYPKKSLNANIQLRKHWELPYFTSSCPHPPPPPHSMEGRKKEMLMTLVRHPRNSHPEMDSPFKIPSKYAPDEGRIGSFFWDGARSSPYFTHNALGQKMLNAFLV